MSRTAPKTYITSGHSACSGCCDVYAAKFTLMGAGTNCIIVNPTGCLEVTSTPFPLIHGRFPGSIPFLKMEPQLLQALKLV